ncbi:ABC transporter substrate-binding protein [Lederbergia galactosidilytica]|uniref:Iron ABC transporter substrate-binding protein n=1 Tax=Lederbergia galactosidilytica TaxID=217031 RepID=A0A177ZJ78_9BACI|nr:ABC transporter substrate-binding protein [Lederbergia galactosidilytica]KRG15865.1 iron ABC transporter substrate-binding protein [Virgibacillus soli]MBP1915557.1 iron complex transport system substrate-binding protein [Lederbergia galactosidilytica]OAK67529.1 iron ABC transporter substrate-binding protein [Lederbergia galactosidilytica]
MRKWNVTSIAIILLLFTLLTGCGANADPNTEQPEESKNQNQITEEQSSGDEVAFPVTMKDATGKEVEIKEEPKRIVSLMPSNTEIVFALEKGDNLVGASTEYDNYPEEVNEIEKVAANFELNVEKVLSLKPDLVLAHGSNLTTWESGLKQLEDSGVTVLVIEDAQSFKAVYQTIETIGKALGKKDEANEIVENMQAKLADITEKTTEIANDEKKSVFVEISPAPEIYAAGTGTFMNEMLEAIHSENIVEEEGYPTLNEEAVIKSNPDVIIVNYSYVEDAVDQVLQRAAWKDVTAVKEKQVYQVDEDLVSRSGPRIIEGVEELAKAIYPEAYGE